MNRPRTNNSLGYSPVTAFTPQGEKDTAPANLNGLIPCQLSEPGTTRQTVYYIKPGNVRTRMDEQALLGNTLKPPKWFAVPDAPAPTGPVPRVDSRVRQQGRPVIDLSDGSYHPSAKAASVAAGTNATSVRNNLIGETTDSHGKKYRYATSDEISAALADVDWKFKE